jgi:mRNA interferase MazF
MRGDLVTIALQGDFGKPRPALVIQSNFFFDHPSVTILPITSEIRETPLFRFLIEPSQENGLFKKSQVMIDKIQTVSIEKVSKPFGSISEAQLLEVNRLLTLFLGLA